MPKADGYKHIKGLKGRPQGSSFLKTERKLSRKEKAALEALKGVPCVYCEDDTQNEATCPKCGDGPLCPDCLKDHLEEDHERSDHGEEEAEETAQGEVRGEDCPAVHVGQVHQETGSQVRPETKEG